MGKLGMIMKGVFSEEYLQSLYCRNVNLCGPRKSGKSLWLNEIKEYYISKECPVIYMDFSDCVISNYSEFVLYIKKKMSKVYLDAIEMYEQTSYYCQAIGYAIRVIYGNITIEDLATSLLKLVKSYRAKYYQFNKRPIILIDNLSRPLLYAAEYGFLEEVYSFYDIFLDIDHYELSGGVFSTSFLPVGEEISFYLKYISDEHVRTVKELAEYCEQNGIELGNESDIVHEWHRTNEGTKRNEKKFPVFLEFIREGGAEKYNYAVVLGEKMKSYIAEMETWVIEEKTRGAERKRIAEEKEKAEYAVIYEDDGQVPSIFVGVRNLKISIEDDIRYDKINRKLKDAYKVLEKDTTYRAVYNYFQRLEKNEEPIEGVDDVLYGLKEEADATTSVKNCYIDLEDSYWGRLDVKRVDEKRNVNDLSLIKMYLSAKEIADVLVIFSDAVKLLIKDGSGLFHAKVTRINREDQICIWVTRNDFFVLEKYLEQYKDKLYKPLVFVPYRGKIGISRELYDWTSYNGVLAELISTYFSSIDTIDDIDVLDMYCKYVKAWNGMASDNDLFAKKFKYSNSQELLILLESLSILLGQTIIDDKNILLNEDGWLWLALGGSKNWYQLNKKLVS